MHAPGSQFGDALFVAPCPLQGDKRKDSRSQKGNLFLWMGRRVETHKRITWKCEKIVAKCSFMMLKKVQCVPIVPSCKGPSKIFQCPCTKKLYLSFKCCSKLTHTFTIPRILFLALRMDMFCLLDMLLHLKTWFVSSLGTYRKLGTLVQPCNYIVPQEKEKQHLHKEIGTQQEQPLPP